MLAFELIHGNSAVYGLDWGDGGCRTYANNHDRIYMLKDGEAWVTDKGGKTVHVVPDKLYLFTGGDTARYYRCTKDAHLVWLHSRVESAPGISLFTHYDPPTGVVPGFDSATIMDLALDTLENPSPTEITQGIHHLIQLYQPFLPERWDELFPHKGRAEQLNPAVNYIQSHLGQNIGLKELAATVYLHPTYFSNVFKKVFGKSPLQYHHQQRMRWACSQLLQSNLTISDVAFHCGYNDPLYFSRQFRKEVGVSPRDYRNRRGRLEP